MGGRGQHHVRGRSVAFSRRLAIILVVGVFLLLGIVTAVIVWLAHTQDEMARRNLGRMVDASVDGLAVRSESSLLDYAVWTAAYDHLRVMDIDWANKNIGDQSTEGIFDVAVVLPPLGDTVGWIAGEGTRSHLNLFDPELTQALRQLLETQPVAPDGARSLFATWRGEVWLFSVARVIPQEGLAAGTPEGAVPSLVFGHRLAPQLLELSHSLFMGEISISASVVPGKDHIALHGIDGTPIGHATWEPPTPGWNLLAGLFSPLALLVITVLAVALFFARELVESARHLEAALEEAETANRIKTEFLANVSHELRTPMNGVIGIAQVLRLQNLEPEARRMVDILLDSARAQVDMINELLDMTRIETGTMTLSSEPFEPAVVVENSVGLFQTEAERKGIALGAAIDAAARGVRVGDAIAFRQIVVNLLGNAMKFTTEGRVQAVLGVSAETGALILRVTDTGRGIDPADHHRIFERFAQIQAPATRKGGGAGLGLAIVKALANMMGGDVAVESALGAGTTFTVLLPLPGKADQSADKMAA